MKKNLIVALMCTLPLITLSCKESQKSHETKQSVSQEKENKNQSWERFDKNNSALLLIDHQVGTMGWVGSIPIEDMKSNAVLIAKTAKVLKMPVLLTSSLEDRAQGPLMPELKEIFPNEYATRIQRAGVINAMDDPNFAKAVDALGRKKLIVAGVTNDVCTVYPVLSLLRKGYEVQVVADAGGSPSQLADEMALNRMEKAGATLTGAMQMLAELVGTWTSPDGAEVAKATAEAREARRAGSHNEK